MNLTRSLLALEEKQLQGRPQDSGADSIAARLHHVSETLSNLLAAAKKKGYVEPTETLESLKLAAAQTGQGPALDPAVCEGNPEREGSGQGDKIPRPGDEAAVHADIVKQLLLLKKHVDKQDASLLGFQAQRNAHDEEWAGREWARLLASNATIVRMVSTLHEQGLLPQSLMLAAMLPATPPPLASAPPIPTMAPSENQSKLSHMVQPPQHGFAEQNLAGTGYPGILMPGMVPDMALWTQHAYGLHSGLSVHAALRHSWSSSSLGPPMSKDSRKASHAKLPTSGSRKSLASNDDADDEPAGADDDGGERLRTIMGQSLRKDMKQKSKEELTEEKLFSSNKGVGIFNNNFHVANDIRMLGAVPEELDEEEAKPLQKALLDAVQSRLLKGVEAAVLRDKQDLIRAVLRDPAVGLGGTGAMPGPVSAPPYPYMQQQSVAGMPQMMMQMQLQNQAWQGSLMGAAHSPSPPSIASGGPPMPPFIAEQQAGNAGMQPGSTTGDTHMDS